MSPAEEPQTTNDLVVVAIGRNEGERLHACLRSVLQQADLVVYVDSGSTDDSVPFAESVGAHVVLLDLSIPFTAARARNAGLEEARRLRPGARWVQFVDGDCELVSGWIPRAREVLGSDEQLAVVCGRRRERYRDRTVYNRLCDIEWDTPVGPALASGGDALMRIEALVEVGGFRDGMIAGEEPELCFRLRERGWKVERIDADMTIHDADMDRLAQWWKRAERAGHAYAESAWLHGTSPERMGVKETLSSLAWSSLAGASVLFPPLSPVGVTAVAASSYKVFRTMRKRGLEPADAWLYAANCLAAKVPQAIGAGRLAYRRVRGRPSTLLEYK